VSPVTMEFCPPNLGRCVTTLAALYGRPRFFLDAGLEGPNRSEQFIQGEVDSGQARQGMAGAEPITVGYIRYQ
jgi:hypothetical protein